MIEYNQEQEGDIDVREWSEREGEGGRFALVFFLIC